MKTITVLGTLLVVCLLLFPLTGVHAETPDLALTFNPESVSLYPGGQVQASLILTNNTDSPITGLNLSVGDYPGIAIEPVDLPGGLAEKSRILVPLVISSTGKAFDNGDLLFRVNYRQEKSDGSVIDSFVVNKLTLTAKQILTVDKLITVTAATPLTYLGEKHSGKASLTVRNISQFPLTITGVVAGGARYVTVDPVQYSGKQVIPPQTSKIYDFALSLGQKSYETTSESLNFLVSVEWDQAGYTFTGNTGTALTLPIGIIAGESEILKLLGVPSLALIPGLLVVIIFAFLLKKFIVKFDLEFTPTSAILWVLAITFSIIAILIYRAANKQTDFPITYSFLDIIKIWSYSVAAGIIFWGMAVVAYLIRHRLKFPTGVDTPAGMLRKLARSKSGVYLERVKFKDNPALSYLKFPSDDAANLWIVPPIVVKPTKAAGDTLIQLRSILDRTEDGDVQGVASARGARQVLGLFTWGVLTRRIKVGWKNGKRPIKVAAADITKLREALLVEIDPNL